MQKNEWNKSIVATEKENTAHLPTKHSVLKSRWENYLRGFSETLDSEELTVTYWNDNNAMMFLDNDLGSGREYWDFIKKQDKNNRIKIYAPKVAQSSLPANVWMGRQVQSSTIKLFNRMPDKKEAE